MSILFIKTEHFIFPYFSGKKRGYSGQQKKPEPSAFPLTGLCLHRCTDKSRQRIYADNSGLSLLFYMLTWLFPCRAYKNNSVFIRSLFPVSRFLLHILHTAFSFPLSAVFPLRPPSLSKINQRSYAFSKSHCSDNPSDSFRNPGSPEHNGKYIDYFSQSNDPTS